MKRELGKARAVIAAGVLLLAEGCAGNGAAQAADDLLESLCAGGQDVVVYQLPPAARTHRDLSSTEEQRGADDPLPFDYSKGFEPRATLPIAACTTLRIVGRAPPTPDLEDEPDYVPTIYWFPVKGEQGGTQIDGWVRVDWGPLWHEASDESPSKEEALNKRMAQLPIVPIAPIPHTGLADLAFSALTPAHPKVGDPCFRGVIAGFVDVVNKGTGTTPSSIQVKEGEDLSTIQLWRGIEPGEAVPPGSFEHHTQTLDVAADVTVTLDPNGLVEESDEANNRMTAPPSSLVCRFP